MVQGPNNSNENISNPLSRCTLTDIPKENEKDLRDLPAVIKRSLDIVLVEHMDEVLAKALAIGDGERFLQDGFHEIDDIYEVPPGQAVPTGVEVEHPAGPN